MKSGNPLHYWDTSIFLSWLKGENLPSLELSGLKEIVTKVVNKEVRLITSVITTSQEILKSTLTQEQRERLDIVLKRRNCDIILPDQHIFRISEEIRNYYQQQKAIDGLPNVSTPDALHLATAIHYEADVLYTFDQKDDPRKRRALLPLNGNVAGKYNLTISKPLAKQVDIFPKI